MLKLTRSQDNPILLPSIRNEWEAAGAFNGCPAPQDDDILLVYRALTPRRLYENAHLELSTVGAATSKDGISFTNHRQLIKPEYEWEKFGCEDPRITQLEDTYYICYTALSGYPFGPENIKIAVALSKDGETISERHPVTTFNAKAMALFPEKVNGKYVAILTANTDLPPSKIALAYFDQIDELWSESYWNSWYLDLDRHALSLQRTPHDQIELGGAPVKTDKGWLVIYSYIKNYYSSDKVFGIEAVLLDLDNPSRIIGRTPDTLLLPETEYELYGNVPNVIFPSGAMVKNETLFVYYGAADTSTCVATCRLTDLFAEMDMYDQEPHKENKIYLERFEENPILLPVADHTWENKAVFNPTAVYLDKKVHLIYRAMGDENTSVMGYATSSDGLHIEERLPYPIYTPREPFELKTVAGNSGCEDARITHLGDHLYMCYTAFDGGAHPPRVALTSISEKDFLERNWNWTTPKLISPLEDDDKDACLFPRKIKNKYVFLHRINHNIWIDYCDSLDFAEGNFLGGEILLEPRKDNWDSHKIGVAGPPIETAEGWLLLYHGIDQNGEYKLSAALLEKENPSHVIVRLNHPILEPIWRTEREGQVPNVVFPCGNVVIDDTLYVYYGGADSVTSVATAQFSDLVQRLAHHT